MDLSTPQVCFPKLRIHFVRFEWTWYNIDGLKIKVNLWTKADATVISERPTASQRIDGLEDSIISTVSMMIRAKIITLYFNDFVVERIVLT